MRIKIVSDGTGDHTKVINAETGEEIENVSEVEWRVNAGEIASAFLTVDFAEIEAEGRIEPAQAPGIGKPFKCEMCHEIFEQAWSGEEAEAEARKKGLDVADCGLVCDDCYRKTPWGKDDD